MNPRFVPLTQAVIRRTDDTGVMERRAAIAVTQFHRLDDIAELLPEDLPARSDDLRR
jgi:hypothetical protein